MMLINWIWAILHIMHFCLMKLEKMLLKSWRLVCPEVDELRHLQGEDE